jgi:hypothetical protein
MNFLLRSAGLRCPIGTSQVVERLRMHASLLCGHPQSTAASPAGANSPPQQARRLSSSGQGKRPLIKREGFGSFHSADIEVLIREPDSVFRPPEVYFEMASEHIDTTVDTKQAMKERFGGSMKRKQTFHISEDWTFINHGAFGGSLRCLQSEANAWSILCEQQPLLFFDRYLLPLVAHSLRVLSKYLGCPPDELMPLPNVTAGLNSIISSVPLESGDEVLCTSLTYGSTKKMLKQMCDASSGAMYKEVHLPLPVGAPEDILRRTEKLLSEKTKLVIIDQITSNTALHLPVIELCELVRRKAPNAFIVVDAAHSIFSQHVDIYQTSPPSSSSSSTATSTSSAFPSSSLQETSHLPTSKNIASCADVWISNCHKWLSCPKGAAVMWISPRVAGLLRPAIITHGFSPNSNNSSNNSSVLIDGSNYKGLSKGLGRFSDKDRILSAYAWDGCRNYSAFLTIPSALRFWGRFDDSKAKESSSSSNKIYNNNSDNSSSIISTSRNFTAIDDAAAAVRGSTNCRAYCSTLIEHAVGSMRQAWGLDDDALFPHASLTR